MKEKTIIIFIILITLINSFLPISNATVIKKANLTKGHNIQTHIKFYNVNNWYEIKCGYICYKTDGKEYPAYCISHGLHGVDEEGDYTVNVNSLLEDKKVYNTIINGYPYKTPEQLGVETNDDAYVATKQAINSVVLNREVKTFYKASDEKGEKIINAIYNISEKGKNGNASNNVANLIINKIGNLKEAENYYYQEYKVDANVNISNYTIQSIEDFPKDSNIVDINGVEKKEYNKGENFRITIPKSQLNKNICGKINILANCNTNSIFFGEAPNNTIQNYAITYSPYTQYSANTTLNIKTDTASIKILKKDEETLKPISDVEFELYKEDGTILNKLKTDKNGLLIFNNLYQGTYKIKEINSNNNYIKEEKEYEIEIKYNMEITKTITNKHKKGNFKIIKVDKDNKDITLGGIKFDLIDSNKNIVKHLITDANGEVKLENINIGEYTLKETKTKSEYKLCVDENIIINWNKTSEIIIENEKKKGQLEIYKVDKEDNKIKIPNAEFKILDKNNNVVDKIITDKNGYAISSKLPIGKYSVKEIKTNKEYLLDESIKKIEIEADKITKLEIENKKIKGKIKIIKTSSNDSDVFNIKKGERVSDVSFEIYDNKNNLIETISTDINGEAISKYLEIGRYKVIEKEKLKNYIKSNDLYFVNIEKDNEVKELNIENEPMMPRINIEKIGQEFAKENEEIKYEFNISNNGNTAIENFTWKEYVPFEKISITKMTTGIYNQNFDYKIYYKTNKNEYKFLTTANTTKSECIDFNILSLDKDEKINEIKVDFGNVDIDFTSIIMPNIFVKVRNGVKDNIVNETEIFGNVNNYEIKDKSVFSTIIKEIEIKKKLPKTGC